MAHDDENPTPRVTPYLLYEDVAGALAWLSEVFGFEERLRLTDERGVVTHAEMKIADGLVMMGDPGDAYRSPKRLGARTALVHVYVEDVDAHYERAKAAGAEIIAEPIDQPYGDRRYDAYDLEGQFWSFAQHIRDVPAAEFGAEES
ncbi:MAG TPA: VOC family protein [Gaiellaceae bacterium]